jgi:hypothetical protein
MDKESTTAQINSGESRTFYIPLIGLLSSDKYLPLMKIRGSGLVLQMTLAPAVEAVFSTSYIDPDIAVPINNGAAPNYEVSGVQYVGRLVNFDGQFMNAFDQVLANGGIEIACPTYHNQMASSEAGDYSVNISARSRSIKSVFAIQRKVSAMTSPDYRRNRTDARTKDGMNQYQFRIGQVNYPQTPVNVAYNDGEVSPEAYVELYKSMGLQLNHLTSGTLMDVQNFDAAEYSPQTRPRTDAIVANRIYRNPRVLGKFAIGHDFENFTPESGLENGIDTASNNLTFSLNVKRNTGAKPIEVPALPASDLLYSNPVQIDIYVLVDQFITIRADGSIAVTR